MNTYLIAQRKTQIQDAKYPHQTHWRLFISLPDTLAVIYIPTRHIGGYLYPNQTHWRLFISQPDTLAVIYIPTRHIGGYLYPNQTHWRLFISPPDTLAVIYIPTRHIGGYFWDTFVFVNQSLLSLHMAINHCVQSGRKCVYYNQWRIQVLRLRGPTFFRIHNCTPPPLRGFPEAIIKVYTWIFRISNCTPHEFFFLKPL